MKKIRVMYCIKDHIRARKQRGMWTEYYTCPIHGTSTQFVERGVKGLTKGVLPTKQVTTERFHTGNKPFDFLTVGAEE